MESARSHGDVHFYDAVLRCSTRAAFESATGSSRGTKIMARNLWPTRRGFSLIEFFAVSTLVGILAAIVVPRVVVDETLGKEKIRDHYTAAINIAVDRYHAEHQAWPTSIGQLADDPEFFTDGVPLNPVTGRAFALNAETHQAE